MISTHGAFPGQLDTPAYFRQLKWRLRIGFLIALAIPFAALSVYFHFQFTFTLKERAKLNLIAISESRRNTIDLFLQERVVNIFSQFQSEAFSLTPSRRVMENYLKNLRRVSDAFVGMGFLNEKGSQIGYAGPYPYLPDKIYAMVYSMARDPETGEQLLTMKDFLVHGFAVFGLSLAVLRLWVFFGYWQLITF
jgi:hypothetical protein